jgi:hypothetical protein
MNRKLIGVVGSGLLLALTVGGVAYAAIPDADGVIHGCYDNESG